MDSALYLVRDRPSAQRPAAALYRAHEVLAQEDNDCSTRKRKDSNSSVVEHDIKQRTVDLQSPFRATGVMNEAQLPESIHEEADTRTSRSNHLGQRFLADLRDHSFWNAFLAKVS